MLSTVVNSKLKNRLDRYKFNLDYLKSEDGMSSMLEFAIVAPFLLALLVGVVDVHKACKHYLYLSQAVGQGALYAAGVPNIKGETPTEQAEEENKVYRAGPGCATTTTGAQENAHAKIRTEIEKYLNQNQDLRIAENSTCFETEMSAADADGNQNIRIRVTFGYDPIFPVLDLMFFQTNYALTISLETNTPYLL